MMWQTDKYQVRNSSLSDGRILPFLKIHKGMLQLPEFLSFGDAARFALVSFKNRQYLLDEKNERMLIQLRGK